MYRLPSSTRATSDEYHHINMLLPQQKAPARKKTNGDDSVLPIHDPSSISGRRESYHTKWVHVIPLILLFCVFILWSFSNPVNVTVKEDKIVAINGIDEQLVQNNTEWKRTTFNAFSRWEIFVENKLFGSQ